MAPSSGQPRRTADSLPAGLSRRAFLWGFAALLVGPPTAGACAGRRVASAVEPADLRIAALGARLRRDDPQAARDLERWGRAQIGAVALDASGRRRARRRLTEPGRVRGELARHETVSVGGWFLARSEAALALLFDAALADPERSVG